MSPATPRGGHLSAAPRPSVRPSEHWRAPGDAVRFGFLGAGWIATRAMAPAVHAAAGAVVQAVAARDADRARALEPKGSVYGGGDYAGLLADPDIDVVYISLSNEAHLQWTLAALAAGKHVLCEKPLGLDAREVATMHEAAAAADLLLVEGYFYRWHPRMQRIVELITSGGMGQVLAMSSQFCFDGLSDPRMAANYRLDPARGGGALYDVGVYPVSAAHALLGPDLRVAAAQWRWGTTGVDLETQAVLSASVGAPTSVQVRCAIHGRQGQDLVIDTEAGRVVTGTGETFTAWHVPTSLVIRTPDGAVREEHFAPVDPYQLMIEAMSAVVRGQDRWIVGADDSIAVATTLGRIRAEAAASMGRRPSPTNQTRTSS